MNTPVRLVVLSLSVLALSACASSQPIARAAGSAPGSSNDVRIERDAAYIAHVERMALRRGMDVQWVNPPNRRVAVAD